MKKKMIARKILTVALTASMMVSLIACGGTETESNTQENRKAASEIVEDNQSDSSEKPNEEVKESTKRTKYPLTITTYGSDILFYHRGDHGTTGMRKAESSQEPCRT